MRSPGSQRELLSRGLGSLALLSLCVAAGCASPPADDLVEGELVQRTGHSIERPAGDEFELPVEVDLRDGLDEEEAVAVALWNHVEFRRALASLAVVAADVEQAKLLPNPRLIMQYPVSSKQLEWTLGWALDALWTRSGRVASARHAWHAAAQRVVEAGLRRVAATRSAFSNALMAARLATVIRARADLAVRRAAISSARARRGEISDLDTLRFEADALRFEEDARSARQLADDAGLRLIESLGADSSLARVELAAARPLPPPGDAAALSEEAMRARPELLAARSEVEAAAERLGFEERAIVRLTALLDSNGGGSNPFDIGPGLDIELPFFDRNQARISRAAALLEAASWTYTGIRRRIDTELGRKHAAYAQALAALERWTRDTQPAFERSAVLATEAEQQGSMMYTRVIEVQSSLLEARARSIELEAIARRALIDLELSVGRRLDES